MVESGDSRCGRPGSDVFVDLVLRPALADQETSDPLDLHPCIGQRHGGPIRIVRVAEQNDITVRASRIDGDSHTGNHLPAPKCFLLE
jgi:hypothetical protein